MSAVEQGNPLMQPIAWQGQVYFSTRYFHAQYLQHVREHGGKVTHKRHDNFLRVLRSMPLYHALTERRDIIGLSWGEAGTQNLSSCFKALQYNPLILLNATAQAELTHHLDDPGSMSIAYQGNQQMAQQTVASPALQNFPELRAIVELVEGVAQARLAAAAAQKEAEIAHEVARQATTKADLALAHQEWISIADYVYLHTLEHQFPRRLWSHFGRYLVGYCQEHNIPVHSQTVAGKVYTAEHRYHIKVIEQLLEPWLKRQGERHLWEVT